ncbi:unnamed protein product (macronuclear) [Paramecium tetraurelia]|uniref:Uncharacterized protein n=1 Tax=Paramecium tetraurelia TaxID=5888 RepID=A0BF27_PARTE|nr:uncharacterized protein GSPATT00028179001 [Paramecium tetraurelia]CAK57144.1 unnamed protein product [Paramecium tetraurelia]|eukprot:XP_001424542.1 hypothetical protein (macronuclear) [Paramecium tetraurelia strain d4-2]
MNQRTPEKKQKSLLHPQAPKKRKNCTYSFNDQEQNPIKKQLLFLENDQEENKINFSI